MRPSAAACLLLGAIIISTHMKAGEGAGLEVNLNIPGLPPLDLNVPPMVDLKTPGLCVFYDRNTNICHYHSKNGIRREMNGRCPKAMKDILPTCRGFPDAYTEPQPGPPPSDAQQGGVDVDPSGLTTTLPPSTTPSPSPSHTPSPTTPAVSPAPKPTNGQANNENSKDNTTKKPTKSKGPSFGYGDEEGGERKDEVSDNNDPQKHHTILKGFAAIGVSIGAAVFFAIITTLGVAYYAHRFRQRSLRRAEQRATALAARNQENELMHGPRTVVVPTPMSLGC